MTIMEKAMNEAGITMPMNKRVWMWLKDHPKKSNSEIAATFNKTVATIGTYVSDMEDRGMLVRAYEKRRMKGGGRGSTGHIVERDVSVYEVNPKMRGEFELWPKPKKKAEPPAAPPPVPEVPKADKLSTPEAFSPEKHVAGLTLAENRQLYLYLRDMFNFKE